jgi:hypothetical protein
MAVAITTMGRARAHAGRVNDPDPEVPERATRRSYPAKYMFGLMRVMQSQPGDLGIRPSRTGFPAAPSAGFERAHTAPEPA